MLKESSLDVEQEMKISHTVSVASWWRLFLGSPTHMALKHSHVQRFFLCTL